MDALSKLGISGTAIIVYLVNIGLLIGVLTYVLYKPLLKFLDERRKLITGSIHEAKILKEEFEKTLKEKEKEQHATELRLREEMENLRKFTEQKRAELKAEMDSAKTEMMAKAEEEIQKKKSELLKDAEAQVLDLMKKVILDIVQHKVPEEVIQDSIKDAWKQYSKNV